MPTYDYQCGSCGHHWEMFQSMKDLPAKSCPKCKKRQAKRLLGLGAGLIFKGSGFYETDYKKKSGSDIKEGSAESSGKEKNGAEKSPPSKDTKKSEKPQKAKASASP